MKKILTGCLIVAVIAMIGFGVAGVLRVSRDEPMIDNAGNYLDRRANCRGSAIAITNKSPYVPPTNGELTAAQVERFVAVQTRVRDELGTRWTEIETKSAQIRDKTSENQRDLTFAEFTSVFSEIGSIYMEARRAQVNALNVQRFSDGEYTWVRRRVYEAAGVEIAGGIDLSKIEDLAREGAMRSNVKLPDMPKPKCPKRTSSSSSRTSPRSRSGCRWRCWDSERRRDPGSGIRDPVSNTGMLEVRSLTKYYGALPALRDASFIARPGQILGYLGPNGSGKSTTVRMLVGLMEPTLGRSAVERQVDLRRPAGYRSSSATFLKSRFSTPTSPHPNICAWSAVFAAWKMPCSTRRSSAS